MNFFVFGYNNFMSKIIFKFYLFFAIQYLLNSQFYLMVALIYPNDYLFIQEFLIDSSHFYLLKLFHYCLFLNLLSIHSIGFNHRFFYGEHLLEFKLLDL